MPTRILLFLLTLLLCVASLPLPAGAIPSEPVAPTVSARAAALTDLSSGELLYGKAEDLPLPMASTTKIMTALLAAEELSPDTLITIPPEAVGVEGSSVYLTRGEILTAEELLYALMLASANDAAVALAIAVDGSVEAFVARMNDKAEELGLTHTHFENPHGLPAEGHVTTARELSLVACEALRNERIRTVSSTKRTTISFGEGGIRTLRNHNKLLSRYEGAIGLKTGFTKASGRCLVGAAERDGLTLVSVTLDAPDDWNDHTRLFDYGFSAYESVLLAPKGSLSIQWDCAGGTSPTVTLTNAEELRITLPRDYGKPEMVITSTSPFAYAPVKPGEHLATVTLTFKDSRQVSSPLLSIGDTPLAQGKKSLWERFCDLLCRPFT